MRDLWLALVMSDNRYYVYICLLGYTNPDLLTFDRAGASFASSISRTLNALSPSHSLLPALSHSFRAIIFSNTFCTSA